MNCQEFSERIVDLAIADRDPADDESVFAGDDELRAHYQSCAECHQELTALRETWGMIGLAAGSSQLPHGLAERIKRRVRTTESKKAVARTNVAAAPGIHPGTPPKSLTIWSYAIAAGILGLLVGGQAYYLHRVTAVATASRDPSEAERLRSLERAVAELERLQSASADAELRFVSFQPSDPVQVGREPTVLAHALWNAQTRQLHLFGFDMPNPAPGSTFAVWFVNDEKAALAKTFQPDADGRASLLIDGPEFAATRAVITLESAPIGSVPSDDVWSAASLRFGG